MNRIPANGGNGTAVVIPAFDEAASIAAVLEAVSAQPVEQVIVVDDGSTDTTTEAVARMIGAPRDPRGPRIELLRHPTNRGKGHALRTGMDRALASGAERIISIDADGQHAADDIPRLQEAAADDPTALIIAARTEARDQAPALRRFANEVADFWISWACGRRITDTQSGFRLYPAQLLARLPSRPRSGQGFAFETALLIDAAASGAEIRRVPILTRYEPCGRPSHYRPWRDTWSIIRLVGGRLLRRGMYPSGLLRALRRSSTQTAVAPTSRPGAGPRVAPDPAGGDGRAKPSVTDRS